MLLPLILYSQLIRELSSSLCSVAAHIICSPGRSKIAQQLIKVLPLVFAQLILRSPGQRYNADGYILSPQHTVCRPAPPFPPGRWGGSQSAGPGAQRKGPARASPSRPRLRPLSRRERQRTAKSKMEGQGGRRGADKMDSEGMAGIKATSI